MSTGKQHLAAIGNGQTLLHRVVVHDGQIVQGIAAFAVKAGIIEVAYDFE
nr:hypothetical protein [Paracidobacterium acidisoli]